MVTALEMWVWDRREKNQDEKLIVRDLINVKQNGVMLTPNSEKFLAHIIKEDCGIRSNSIISPHIRDNFS